MRLLSPLLTFIVVVCVGCVGTSALVAGDEARSSMSGNLDALQPHGFLMPPKNPPKGEGAEVDSSGHLRKLTKKVKSAIAGVLVPAWHPPTGKGALLPLAGDDGNPDLFLSSYQVRDYHVKLVVGEFGATIVLAPKGAGSVALRTARGKPM